MGKRLSAEERKKIICQAAKKLFIAKGFLNTTMEDVMYECALSKGGLYHHYGNTSEILYDLMRAGNEYRFSTLSELSNFSDKHSLREALIDSLVEKMVDTNDYKSIYAIFLVEAEKKIELKKLYLKIKKETSAKFVDFLISNGLDELCCLADDYFISFINSIIVSVSILDVKDEFIKNKAFLRKIIEAYICDNKK